MAKTLEEQEKERRLNEAFNSKLSEAKGKSVIPDSLLASQNNQIATRQNQIASDVAHQSEPVMLRDPNLPPEVAAFANPAAIAAPAGRAPADASGGFIDPNAASQAAQAPSIAPQVESPVATTGQELGIPEQTSAINQAHNVYEKQAVDTQAQIDALNKERQDAIQKRMDADDQEVEKVKPTDIFAGKATWQKILGGVGMFLGSITPEGARNVANMIDKEIDRDQQLQLNNIKLKRDKDDRHYQNLLQKYGSQEAALLAKKRDAYTALGLHVNKLEAAAKGAMARQQLGLAKEEIALKRQELGVKQILATQAAHKEQSKGGLPGYQGMNQNPTVVKDMTDSVAAQRAANNTITQLEGLLDQGALNPLGENYAKAQQLRESLAADLAKAMFGRSSDSELEVARRLIPDITSFTQRGAVDKSLFKNLKDKLAKDVDSRAQAAGFSKVQPFGARKI